MTSSSTAWMNQRDSHMISSSSMITLSIHSEIHIGTWNHFCLNDISNSGKMQSISDIADDIYSPRYLNPQGIFERVIDDEIMRIRLWMGTNYGIYWAINITDGKGNPLYADKRTKEYDQDELEEAIDDILSEGFTYIGHEDMQRTPTGSQRVFVPFV